MADSVLLGDDLQSSVSEEVQKSSTNTVLQPIVIPQESSDDVLIKDTERVEDVEKAITKHEPVPIVLVNEDHSFSLDEDAINSILMDKDVAHLPVVIISVAGAFRKGKSFLLNFLLRYLNSSVKEDWIGDPDEELLGFSWSGGSERVTTGIWMWSKAFIVTLPSNEKVAVALMDTQGAFDALSTVKDCATIFALSTMTSSMQLYNLSQNIQEDDFQHLELFTEYGRLAMEESSFKPFQSLQFLVRDWSYPYEFSYGLDGGEKLLNKRLELSEKQHVELQRVRTHIKSCFAELTCFLMPHPGLAVACNPNFKGALKDITPEFKEYMNVLAPILLAPDHLKVKEINGEKVTCAELVEYFRSYIKIYDGEKLPEPKTMLQATAEANNLAAVVKSRELYSSLMDKICGSSCPYVNPNILEESHKEAEVAALECFDTTRKMGGDEFSLQYRDKLEEDLQVLYDNYLQTNASKNVFKNIRTPCVFFTFVVIFYALSGLFSFVYLSFLSTLCYLAALVFLVFISTWAYVHFTGQYYEIGQALESAADHLWENVFRDLSAYLVEQGTKHISQETIHQMSTKIKSS